LNNKKQKGLVSRENTWGRKWLSQATLSDSLLFCRSYYFVVPKINKEGKIFLDHNGSLNSLLVASFTVHIQHVRRRMELYMAFVRKMEPNTYFINAY